MPFHIILCVLVLLSGLVAPARINGQAAAWQNKIAPGLAAQVSRPGEPVDFTVVLKAQADLSLAATLPTKTAKGHYVYHTLQALARKEQAPLRALLRQRNIPHRAFYLVNAIGVQGDRALLELLAQRPEVAKLLPDPVTVRPLVRKAPAPGWRQAIEWHLTMIGAPAVWELGIRGQGVVVGGQDTGVYFEHPALFRQYRGNRGDTVVHDYNWHDSVHEFSPLHGDANNPCGLNLAVPCDDDRQVSHGTLITGLMVGADTSGVHTGVAPEARWIAVRNMERGYGSPQTYLESFEWFLAPTRLDGSEPDPAMAPHVINNSWYCPELEGCTPEVRPLMETAVRNLRAAGIVVVVSAGNFGDQCLTISEITASFPEVFSVGATNADDQIAGFSSRGPVYSPDSTLLIKPDLMAPGAGVRSTAFPDGYLTAAGTSLAGPLVAGTVALMISANPQLAGQVDTIEAMLRRTAAPKTSAQDCGGISGAAIPNPVYGHGRLDALAAVEAALSYTPSGTTDRKNAPFRITAAPNPFSDRLLLQWDPAGIRDLELQVISVGGQLLLRQHDIDPATAYTELNLRGVPPGIYFIRYQTDRSVGALRVVRQ